MSDYLADTSVFIAAQPRPDARPAPEGAARVSVATLTELQLSVLNAREEPLRELRALTLARARAFIPLDYDEHVSERLASLIADVRRSGRRANVMDCIIAATAMVHDLTVWTQDQDFAVLAAVAPALSVHGL